MTQAVPPFEMFHTAFIPTKMDDRVISINKSGFVIRQEINLVIHGITFRFVYTYREKLKDMSEQSYLAISDNLLIHYLRSSLVSSDPQVTSSKIRIIGDRDAAAEELILLLLQR